MDMWFVLDTPRDLKKSPSSPSAVKATPQIEQEQPSEIEEETIQVLIYIVFSFLRVFLLSNDMPTQSSDERARRRQPAGWIQMPTCTRYRPTVLCGMVGISSLDLFARKTLSLSMYLVASSNTLAV